MQEASCSSSALSNISKFTTKEAPAQPLQRSNFKTDPKNDFVDGFLKQQTTLQQSSSIHNQLSLHPPNQDWSNQFINQPKIPSQNWVENFNNLKIDNNNNQNWAEQFASVESKIFESTWAGKQIDQDFDNSWKTIKDQDWTEQFDQVINTPGVESMLQNNEMMDEWTKTFEESWNNGSVNVDQDWHSDFDQFMLSSSHPLLSTSELDPITGPLEPYTFESENSFLNHQDPFSEALKMIAAKASLSTIALAFEAAVQRDQTNSDAWMQLGIIQAENEKESPAIAALQRSVKENQSNQKALIVCFTNLESCCLLYK